jgi:membrane-associated phospholipid phosphatase
MKCAFAILLFVSHFGAAQKSPKTFSEQVSKYVFASSRVMMHDVVNPPAASRYYAYIMFGAYEIVAQNDSIIPPLPRLFNHFNIEPLANKKKYDYQVAALYCILETGRLMLPSGYMLKEEEEEFIAGLSKQKMDTAIINQSLSVGGDIAKKIVALSKADHYNQLSARMRYSPVKGDAYWFPTPPAYIEAVEPNWKIVRPLFIDSSDEFKPSLPIVFSKDSTSNFYKLAREVYDVSRNLSDEQLAMAAFWDCNPFAVSTSGHMSIGFKKISPGGHWMSIAGIAATRAKLSFNQSILLHTILSATIMDAFISCWDEKYRSNRIRPETVINRYIDVRWQPLLQTPPFPEYPSGHSVISTASAEVLTYFLGEDFSYIDDSEIMFELPPRSFKSFRHAAREAAISRLYGGIHFRDAIENGQVEGKAVGVKVITKIKAAGIRPFRD